MNLFQQWGLGAMAGGALLGFLRMTNAPLPTFNVSGGQAAIVLPPDWVTLLLLVGGLVLIVMGTAWKVIRGERSEEKDRSQE
jgi:hypothetical protein